MLSIKTLTYLIKPISFNRCFMVVYQILDQPTVPELCHSKEYFKLTK